MHNIKYIDSKNMAKMSLFVLTCLDFVLVFFSPEEAKIGWVCDV